MTANAREECEHGSLKRKCERCYDAQEIAELKDRITDLERRNGGLEKASRKLIRAVERSHKSGGSVDDFANLQSCIAAVKAVTTTGRKQ